MSNANTMKTNESHNYCKARPHVQHWASLTGWGNDYPRSAVRGEHGVEKPAMTAAGWLRSQGVKSWAEQTLTARFHTEKDNTRQTTNTLPGDTNPSQEHDLIFEQHPQSKPSLHGHCSSALRSLCLVTAPVSSRLHHTWQKAELRLAES